MAAKKTGALSAQERYFVNMASDPLIIARHHPAAVGFPVGPPENSLLLFSSNNDSSFAPSDKAPEMIADLSGPLNALNDTWGMVDQWPATMKNDVKRNILQKYLKDQGRADFDFSFWRFEKDFLQSVAVAGAVDSSNFQPFRRENLLNCYKNFQYGTVDEFSPDDADPFFAVHKKNCGNKYCPWCGSRRRDVLASDYLDFVQQCLDKYGIRKAWSFVFTLPAALEDISYKSAVLLRKEIAKIIRSAFGCSSRDNLGMVIAIHPVGSKDLFRPRVHFHVFVVPMVILEKSRVESRDKFSIDLVALRDAWDDVLGGETGVINPEVEYYSLSTSHGMAQFTHRIKYDLRSFSKDFENSVLLHSAFTHEVILKCEKEGRLFWRCVPMDALALRWVQVVDFCRVQPFGWLQKREAFRALGFFDAVLDVAALVPVSSAPCVIEFKRCREWNDLKKRVVWVRSEFVHIDGQRLQIGVDIDWL